MDSVTFREGSNKIYQSSLEGLSFKITDYRRDGNTTRIIDNAIQILFRGFVCVIHDHHGMGSNRDSNENLVHRIIDRLANEHGMRIGEDFRINWDQFEIEFISTGDVDDMITALSQSLIGKQMDEAKNIVNGIFGETTPKIKCNHNAIEKGSFYECSICGEIL